MNNVKINNFISDFSSVQLTPNSQKKIFLNNNNNSIINSSNKYNNNENKMKIRKVFNNTLIIDKNKIMNKNINNIDSFRNKKNDISNLSFNNINNNKNNYNLQNNKNTDNNLLLNEKPKINYIKQKLFPYRFYLYSIFIQNSDDSKKSLFFTKQFTIVNNFICQLFDISSYLILQREFQTMKNTIIEEEQRNIIEKGQRININAKSFNIKMREFWENNKLSIFGRIN